MKGLRIMKRRHAFSLIELMMVITIMAVLFAVVLPAFNVVRDGALSVRCTSALRQIGMGCRIYADHERGFVPDAYRSAGGIAWNMLIDPYLDNEATSFQSVSKLMYECPMYKRFASDQPYSSDPNANYWRITGFGMNSFLNLRTREDGDPESRFLCNDYWFARFPTSFRFATITFLSNRALIGDSTNNRIITQAPALIWREANPNGRPSHNDPERHHGRANYVMCDIHVASLTSNQGLLAIGDPEFLQ